MTYPCKLRGGGVIAEGGFQHFTPVSFFFCLKPDLSLLNVCSTVCRLYDSKPLVDDGWRFIPSVFETEILRNIYNQSLTLNSHECKGECQGRIQDSPWEGATTLQVEAPTYDFTKNFQKTA